MLRHLAVGLDRYDVAGNDLEQCVRDSDRVLQRIADAMRAAGAQTPKQVQLTDAEATRGRIVDALGDMVSGAAFGDTVLYTQSSHGTYLADVSGDEPDGRDEAICCYDLSKGRDGLLIDDDLAEIMKASPGVTVIVAADMCHSGSLARLLFKPPSRPRFIHPQSIFGGALPVWMPWWYHAEQQPLAAIASLRTGPPIYFGACRDVEFAYETSAGGAFTNAWISAMDSADTIGELFACIDNQLPTALAPQNPTLHCTADQRDWRLPWR